MALAAQDIKQPARLALYLGLQGSEFGLYQTCNFALTLGGHTIDNGGNANGQQGFSLRA